MSYCPRTESYSAWCGLCYDNARGRGNHRGHGGYRPVRVIYGESLYMALKKRVVEDTGAHEPMSPGLFGKSYPTLFEFLTGTAYETGERRIPGTLSLFMDQGAIKACLNDKDQGLTTFSSASTVDRLFAALEKGLAEDTLVWRKPAPFSAKKKK